jgi:hypothetical protein
MESDCCSAPEFDPKQCPSCGTRGHRVPPATLVALARVPPEATDPWRFCPSNACEVVWFGETTRGVVERVDLRVRVGVKETAADRPICYCFGHDGTTIAARATTDDPVYREIRERCRRGEDRCETTNPQGHCCLADVLAIEREARG